MPNNSLLNPIMNGIATAVGNLGLTWSAAAIPVSVRKIPTRGQTLDACPQIVVCKGRPPQATADSKGKAVRYFVNVVLIAPNDDDQLSNIDDSQAFDEIVRNNLERVPVQQFGVGAVWDVRCTHLENYQPHEIAQGYETNAVQVAVSTEEATPGAQ